MVDGDPKEDVEDTDDEKDRLYEGTGGNIDEGNHSHGYQAWQLKSNQTWLFSVFVKLFTN